MTFPRLPDRPLGELETGSNAPQLGAVSYQAAKVVRAFARSAQSAILGKDDAQDDRAAQARGGVDVDPVITSPRTTILPSAKQQLESRVASVKHLRLFMSAIVLPFVVPNRKLGTRDKS